MANLKLDLTNKVQNDKYFAEIELVRLAQDVNMNYKNKINEMTYFLEQIALLNAKMGLIEQYFTEAPVNADGTPAPVAAQPQQGQTHAE